MSAGLQAGPGDESLRRADGAPPGGVRARRAALAVSGVTPPPAADVQALAALIAPVMGAWTLGSPFHDRAPREVAAAVWGAGWRPIGAAATDDTPRTPGEVYAVHAGALALALHDVDCGCDNYDQVEDPRYIDAVRSVLDARDVTPRSTILAAESVVGNMLMTAAEDSSSTELARAIVAEVRQVLPTPIAWLAPTDDTAQPAVASCGWCRMVPTMRARTDCPEHGVEATNRAAGAAVPPEQEG